MVTNGTTSRILYYRQIAAGAFAHLKKGGVLLLEIGFDEAAAVTALFASYGETQVIRDLENHDRVVKVVKNV